QLGISEESALLTQWFVREGDKVDVGDKLFSIETGKSSFDVPSDYAGTVLKLILPEGEEALIQAPICAIGDEGESYVAEDVGVSIPSPQPAPSVPQVELVHAVPVTSLCAGAGCGVSPRARTLAAKADIDPKRAVPTGPEGRVIERDVRALLEHGVERTAQPTAAYEDRPMSHLRKIIAKNMLASLTQTAQVTHTASFDATNIRAYRALLKSDPENSGVTLTDMILYAVTRTLPDFPELNAWVLEDGATMRYFSEVNLACAVDTEKGLLAPVIFGASNLSLLQISKALKELAEGCRAGTAPTKVLSGGSFTVSNLGMYGIEHFTPILNTPQTGILGVNTITQRVRGIEGGLQLYPCMTLSLTYDHRAVDGAPASRFLQALCKNLEGFSTQ
ncbi:MAG: 2-oxo acid dehydrogenase subunit E2, partial [Clostridia bacterium]|nr:2-oxo acid dehydrogenase subunit E2 [Clostridia bacterium]